jgi:hypothetical protein
MATVYKFTSPSGKHYIGLTSSTMERRWRQHLTLWRKLSRKGVEYRGNSATPILFYAFDKYPPDQWIKEVVFQTSNLEEAKSKEIEFISLLDTTNRDFGYNVLVGGQTGWAGKNLSEDHKEKQSKSRISWYDTEEGKLWKEQLSQRWSNTENNPSTLRIGQPGFAHTEESKEKIRQAKIGTKATEKTKKKLSDKKLSFYKSEKGQILIQKKKEKRLTQEEKDQISKSLMGHKQTDFQKESVAKALSKSYLITNPEGQTFQITNLNKYCRDNNLHVGNMCSVASGKLKQYKGFKVQKLEI